MSFFTRERLDLALSRTNRQFYDLKKYAFQNPVQTCAMIGTVFVLSVYFPAVTILALCVSALALIGLNLYKEPDLGDASASVYNSISDGISSLYRHRS